MNPAPPLSARPAIGTTITVSSTRRDKDSDGVVLAHDEVGIRIRCTNEVGEMAVERFYPWGQVAFTQWAVQAVAEMATDITSDEVAAMLEADEGIEAAIDEVADMLEAEAQATGSDLAVDVAVGLAPQVRVQQQLAAWRSEPVEDCWDSNFAQTLQTEGFPVTVYVRKPAVERDIIPAETSWDGGIVEAFGSINDDDRRQPGDPFLKPVGRMLVTPEVKGYRVPQPILDLAPDADLAVWAAINHTPAELNTIYSLHEGDFHHYMDRLRQGDRPHGEDEELF